MSSKIVLGRGLDALIPTLEESGARANGTYRLIPLDKIAPNPMQPRQQFDESSLHELAESFKSQGVLQPILVRQNNDMFILIAGERRYRAAHLAEMKNIPAIIIDQSNEGEMLQMALVENLQREDLNPLEAAEAFQRLMDDGAMTQNQLATRVGKSRAAVANSLRLLGLPDKIKEMIRAGKLTEGHARAVLAVDGGVSQVRLAERIISENMSVRDAEETARHSKRRRSLPRRKNPSIIETENYLKQLLGTAVKITPGLKRGRIEVDYYGEEDLERLLELFRKIN
ncbi:MAG: chromosome partitioning protein ParB [candidate division Zixibacteria bacterium HGW-Zixibacteria-1]|nr:MAG: chromosome partitioning protein ParB [candidate division Zixibacteria bacterium HGW-Zixibacteria-1]